MGNVIKGDFTHQEAGRNPARTIAGVARMSSRERKLFIEEYQEVKKDQVARYQSLRKARLGWTGRLRIFIREGIIRRLAGF